MVDRREQRDSLLFRPHLVIGTVESRLAIDCSITLMICMGDSRKFLAQGRLLHCTCHLTYFSAQVHCL